MQVANNGAGILSYSASTGSSWLELSPGSGSTSSTVSVQATTSGLAPGSYNGSITIASPAAINNPVIIPVSMQLGSVTFSDDFSSGSTNWTVSPLGFSSGWSVTNNTYAYDGEGHTQSWAGSGLWTNYTVAVDFRLSLLDDYPGGLRGRVNPSNGASYGVWILPAERILKLYRIGDWNIDTDNALLAQSRTLTMDTNVHNLRLSFQGSTIQAYYDNVLVITANDTSYTQGGIALDVSNRPISFSNVKVIGF
jgi:hypothetical protein